MFFVQKELFCQYVSSRNDQIFGCGLLTEQSTAEDLVVPDL